MGSGQGWTEAATSSTVTAVIRCDDPVLRPRRRRDVRAVVSRREGASIRREGDTLEVAFTDAAVWDVARIATRLELRQTQDPRRDPRLIIVR